MDVFSEQIVKQSLDAKRLLLVVGAFLGAVLICTAAYIYFMMVFLPLLCFAVFGLYWLVRMMSWEVEYAVTEGDIDIDRIIGRSKRKTIVRVRGNRIEKLLPISPEALSKHYDRVVMAASKESNATWYFTYRGKMGSTIVLFEPTEDILKALRSGLQRSVQVETDRALRER